MKKLIEGKNQIQEIYKIRTKIKKLQEIEEQMTKDAIMHIEIYSSLKQDNWLAVIDIIEKRCPHWKEELEKRCGQKVIESIITKTKPVKCKRLSIHYKGKKYA